MAELNLAYLDWPDANIGQSFGLVLPSLLGQPIAEYVDATLDRLCVAEPPEGTRCPSVGPRDVGLVHPLALCATPWAGVGRWPSQMAAPTSAAPASCGGVRVWSRKTNPASVATAGLRGPSSDT